MEDFIVSIIPVILTIKHLMKFLDQSGPRHSTMTANSKFWWQSLLIKSKVAGIPARVDT